MNEVELSPRMVEVVVLIGRDRLSYFAAGQRLGISEHTVRTYAQQIRERCNSDRPPREAIIDLYRDEEERFQDELDAA